MTDQRPKIAALVTDAFQEEEYFFPKFALNEAGYQVEVVSSRKQQVEIYSYFARTGLLDVERAIADARPEDYVGVLIPGGAKSPALLAEDPRVTKFVRDVSARGGVVACICRGSMLAARSRVVAGRRMTGFNDSASYPELVVQPDAEAAGAIWVQDAPVVVDRNLVTSPHRGLPAAFAAAIIEALGGKCRHGCRGGSRSSHHSTAAGMGACRHCRACARLARALAVPAGRPGCRLARRYGVCPRAGAPRLGHRYHHQGRFERPHQPADRHHPRERTIPLHA